MNAEIMALESFAKDETYSLSKNIDRVRTEQCNQTDFMEEIKKKLEEIKTKTGIIKTLPENVNTVTNAYRIISEKKKSDTDKLDIYEQRTTSNDFREPRRSFKMLNSKNKTVTEPIKV